MEDAESAARKHLILTELFGVNPRVIVDNLVVSANEHLYVLGSQLEETVRGMLGDAEDAERKAEQGVHAITTLLEHSIDHAMDTFELFCLRSIFVITPEQSRLITMAHHRGLDLRASDLPPAGNAPLLKNDEEVPQIVPPAEDMLRRKIAGARATQHRLAQAERASKVRLERAELMRSAYAFIVQGARSIASDDVRNADVDALMQAMVALATKVRSDTDSMMEALEILRDNKPLSCTLLPLDTQEPARDEEPMLGDQRQWEKGRDEYLNWEASRIIASMKQSTNAPQ
ncbi:hypothetical protein MVES_002755 [Malassezia vespertilionis]|uniref:Uncharacterized protein n=1 Tax=Malassezia vespertilionis TaxID=2020962 RepID=A0A2N1J941_9BASI|nr:hypothetical protein MVES_002755 [Malassezia vespertilionis]